MYNSHIEKEIRATGKDYIAQQHIYDAYVYPFELSLITMNELWNR